MGATVPAGEFKATCLHLLDVVAQRHEEIVITKRGHPVARLVPVPDAGALFGAMAGSVARSGGLVRRPARRGMLSVETARHLAALLVSADERVLAYGAAGHVAALPGRSAAMTVHGQLRTCTALGLEAIPFK